MRPFPARFYPVVDTVAWVERLVRLGVATVQLRAKDLSPVNDYWRAAIDAGAHHVHLGQEDLAQADVPAIRRAGLSLGLSTHDDEELETALRHDPDYVALGPIYPTMSKHVAFDAQGLARIGEWKRRVGAVPLVAIGGITLERAPDVFAAGADAVAVLSDVTQATDPDARARAWLAAVTT
jgi:thiamine-phosphate pyrophosphorylase